MKTLLLVSAAVVTAAAQTRPAVPADTMVGGPNSNLPAHRISPNDLIGIAVYDAPEFTRSVRVRDDGMINLPMLKSGIKAAGLMPLELEDVIAKTLKDEEILVRPLVTVTMIEYNARRVSIVGAVLSPQTFQVIGQTRLLDALAKAGGLSQEAGPELVLRREDGTMQNFVLKKLLSGDSEGMNVMLEGGEEIRVPPAKKVFIVGNVTKPQVIPVRDPADLSVLRILAQVEGPAPYYASTAYIFRDDPVTGKREQIPVALRAILHRKAPDVNLKAEDIFYVPDDLRKHRSADVAKALLTTGQSAATALIYVAR
jgi:polysaccharide export outer membrane protein